MFRIRGRCRALTLTFAAVAATALTVALAIAMLIVGTVVVAVVILARAVLPSSWRHRSGEAATPWPGTTIDTTIVAEEERKNSLASGADRQRPSLSRRRSDPDRQDPADRPPTPVQFTAALQPSVLTDGRRTWLMSTLRPS